MGVSTSTLKCMYWPNSPLLNEIHWCLSYIKLIYQSNLKEYTVYNVRLMRARDRDSEQQRRRK